MRYIIVTIEWCMEPSIGLKKLIERIDNESAVPVSDVRLDDLSSAAF